MQNPGQTQIFYKVGQTRMTHKKSDPDDLDDPIRLQRCLTHKHLVFR